MAFIALKGITVTLYTETQTGVNAFNEPIYSTETVTVNNVLVAPASEQEILDTMNLTGRKAIFTLGIPKGDTNTWTNTVVEFSLNGVTRKYRTIGEPTEGIDELIPLSWNKKVRVETYVEQ